MASGRAWIYLRDARLHDAEHTADVSCTSIEPTYGDRDPVLLATYGWHVTFAAVVAARQGDTTAAQDLLSQGSAVAARLGRDVKVNGTAFGPAVIIAQAIGIAVSTGNPGKALRLAQKLHDTSSLHPAAQNRLQLDIALAQCDTKQYDSCLTRSSRCVRSIRTGSATRRCPVSSPSAPATPPPPAHGRSQRSSGRRSHD
ncbi:hypothetical protein ACWC5F_08150 [Streptomyces sp. NPDC001272]